MICKNDLLPELNPKTFPLELGDLKECCFLDIETTGFTAQGSYLYLIGCIVYEEDGFHARQWLAQKKQEEPQLLDAFAAFIAPYKRLIHFNGNRFDIPYLAEKYEHHKLVNPLSDKEGIDLFRRIEPYKAFLRLPDCKQKTIEAFLGVNREDVLSGKELIGVYLHYEEYPNDEEERLLLLHNAEDIAGLIRILPILSYVELANLPIQVTKVSANYYSSFDGKESRELLMKCKLPTALPVQISTFSKGCYFTGHEHEGMLKIPIYHGELKYFYANYRDYYYLPDEDCALHKSISAFVDPSHRTKATKENCYTRKEGDFLPEWDTLVSPFFKKEYKDHTLFFELTDEIKQNRELFSSYASHILLEMMKNAK